MKRSIQKKEIAKLLTDCRDKRLMTRRAAAREAKISAPSIYAFERGDFNSITPSLKKLIKFYGAEADIKKITSNRK